MEASGFTWQHKTSQAERSERRTSTGKRVAALLTASAIALGSCAPNTNSPGSKQVVGTAIGAIAGAALGAALGKGKGRILGAALGALAGGIIGSAIGRYLDETDRKRMAQATRLAALTGRAQAWKGAKSGVRGTVRVAASERRSGTVRVAAYKDRVEKMPPLDLVNDTFEATSTVNVRSGPGTEYRVVDRLTSGEKVQVIGKVQGANWYVIARDGVASGFVHGAYLVPTSTANSAQIASSPPPGAEVVEVSAVQTCRVVVQQVQLADGREIEDRVKVCPGPAGWEVQDI